MGGRPPDKTDREILLILAESEDPVVSTTEVAEVLGFSQKGAFNRLDAFDEAGLVNSKLIGDAKAWWLTPTGKTFLEGDRDFATAKWEEDDA